MEEFFAGGDLELPADAHDHDVRFLEGRLQIGRLRLLVPAGDAGAARVAGWNEEIVDGFEEGIKISLFDSNLTLNAVAFSYDYQDLQVSVSDPVSLSSRTLNAAKSQVRGAELETVWAPRAIQNLTIRANLNYLDNTFDEFIGDCYTGQTISRGCNINLNPVTGRYVAEPGRARPAVLAELERHRGLRL